MSIIQSARENWEKSWDRLRPIRPPVELAAAAVTKTRCIFRAIWRNIAALAFLSNGLIIIYGGKASGH
jgi:hypothetical protein